MLNCYDVPNGVGVYLVRCRVTGEAYIGCTTTSFHTRLHYHAKLLKNGRHYTRRLQALYNLYGFECFEVGVLEFTDNPDNARPLEAKWQRRFGRHGYLLNENIKHFHYEAGDTVTVPVGIEPDVWDRICEMAKEASYSRKAFICEVLNEAMDLAGIPA